MFFIWNSNDIVTSYVRQNIDYKWVNNEVVKSGEKAVDVFFVCDILIQVVRTQRKSDDSTSLKHVNLIQKVLKKVLDEILWTWYYNQVASARQWLANRSLKTEQW